MNQYQKNKSKNNFILCNKCNRNKGLVRMCDTYEIDFYSNSKKIPLWCKNCYLANNNFDLLEYNNLIKCGNCQILYQDNLFKNCDKCKQQICSFDCLKITGCQTNSCVCKKCFCQKYIDGKCIKCKKNKIKIEDVYIWDGEPSPYCSKCI